MYLKKIIFGEGFVFLFLLHPIIIQTVVSTLAAVTMGLVISGV